MKTLDRRRPRLAYFLPLGLSLSLLAAGCAGQGSSNPKGGATLGLAVVNSDFKSTSVSLIDPKTGVLSQDDCINSGSATSVLSMALSGDVSLPSQPQPNDELLLIDRTNAALAWLDPSTCAVKRQASVGTGFYANPHDVVAVSGTKAYVSRYERNATPKGGNDGGDDLLIFDPSTGAVTGRIDVASYAVGGEKIQARPDRLLLAAGKVYLSLNNQSGDFMSAGAGRVLVIDPTTDKVSAQIELPGLKNCSGLDFVASSSLLLVSCGGDFNSADQAAESAVVLVDVSGAVPAVKKTLPASLFGGRALAGSVGAVSAQLAIVVTSGDFAGSPPDALWALDLSAGSATKIADGDGAFVLGGVSADLAEGRLYVTSAGKATPRVLVFDISAPAAIKLENSFEANPKSGLPPRQIAWY